MYLALSYRCLNSEKPNSIKVKDLVKVQQVEILDKVYSCINCEATFLFKSDVEDHQRIVGHSEMRIYPLN